MFCYFGNRQLGQALASLDVKKTTTFCFISLDVLGTRNTIGDTRVGFT